MSGRGGAPAATELAVGQGEGEGKGDDGDHSGQMHSGGVGQSKTPHIWGKIRVGRGTTDGMVVSTTRVHATRLQ